MMENINSICRCCYSGGSCKELYSTYKWMGDNEVYGDMLKQCFDISLTNADSSFQSSICEVCITQLRNAFNFKKQVLLTEHKFKRRLGNCKQENFKSELSDEDAEIHCLMKNDPDNLGDNVQLNLGNVDTEIDYLIEEHLEDSDFDGKFKEEDEVPLLVVKKKQVKQKGAKKLKAVKTETTTKSSDANDGVAKKTNSRKKKGLSKESATPERLQHRVNLTAILQYSNASPFRDKTKNGFSCLYCCQYFKDINDLRIHTAQQTEKDKLNLMIDYKLSYNPIKIDITDLLCTVCDMEMSDLTDLKEHLVTVHNKVIHKNIKDIILPFRLEDGTNYMCVVCSVAHISFKNLYHHMSCHYRNYCCNECGTGYITIAALRKHYKTHENGSFPCSYCEKTYTSLSKKKQHERGVHTEGWLRNKCPHCPKVFVSYYDRSEHLVTMHNETPIIYPCNACNRVYKKKFELNRHIKHHHLQQHSYKCDMCNAKFFSKRGLTDHRSRHDDGEQHPCSVCTKKFSRLRSLKEHMKGHEVGKQFQCEICKKMFMQKCSLKSHIRLHQDDLDIFKEFDDVKHLIDNRDITLKQIAAENRMKEQAERERTLDISMM